MNFSRISIFCDFGLRFLSIRIFDALLFAQSQCQSLCEHFISFAIRPHINQQEHIIYCHSANIFSVDAKQKARKIFAFF